MKQNIWLIALGAAIALSSIAFPFIIGNIVTKYNTTETIDYSLVFLAGIAIITTPSLRFIANLTVQKYNAKTRTLNKKSVILNIIDPKAKSISPGRAIDLVDGDTDGTIYLFHGIYLDITSNFALLILAFSVILYNYPVYAIPPAVAITYSLITQHLHHKKLPKLFDHYIEQNTMHLESVCSGLNSNRDFRYVLQSTARKRLLKTCIKSNFKLSVLEFSSSLSYLLGLVTLILLYTHVVNHDSYSTGAFISAALYVEKVLVPVFGLISIYYSTAESQSRKKRIDKNTGLTSK